MINNKIKEKINKITTELMDLEMDIAKDLRDKIDKSEISIHGELFNSISIAIRYLRSAEYKIEQEEKHGK